MTTIDTHATGATVPSGGPSVATNTTESVPLEGVLGWLTTADHKRIGRMFIGVGLLATLTVAALGILLALDRMITSREVFNADVVPQLFSAYRVTLVFAALVPVMLGLTIAVVPLQLGARSLAFPRVAAMGFWTWFFGLVLVTITIVSWWLAPGHSTAVAVPNVAITVAVVVLGFIKGRLIIRYFMEVRGAPRWLKLTTDAWLAVLWLAVLGIYLF